jgi:hypothetical protein
MNKTYLILFVVFNITSAWAQLTDRFGLYGQSVGGTNDVSMDSFLTQATHRFYIGDSTILNASLQYSQLELNNKNLASDEVDAKRSLYTLVPNLSFIISLNYQNNLIIIARPGFYGDGEGDINDDFRAEGGFLLTQVLTDKLTMGLGAARGTNLGRDLIVPLLQFSYYYSDKITISGVLPVRASMWYIHNEDWQFGTLFRLEGSVYNIDETSIPDAKAIGVGHAFLGGGAKYRVFGQSYLAMEGGVTALRRYEWVNATGASTDIGREAFQEVELDNTAYIRLGFEVKY